MLGRAILFVLLILAGIAVLPFLASSLYIDQRGVPIPGTVFSKREDVSVHYLTLKRSAQATVEYRRPDGLGVAFLSVHLLTDDYDGMHVGQAVSLHYLRPQDVPDVPFAKFLRKAQLLPTVRLANQQISYGFREQLANGGASFTILLIAGAILLLVVWGILRIPGLIYGLILAMFVLVALTTFHDFPRPTPPPTSGVRQATGHLKSLARIDKLFNGDHSRGIEAEQPIQVLGIEFVPEGRTDSVLAMDLIDEGSIPGLREKATVTLDYESAAPRTAYVQGATRKFVSRNVRGLIMAGAACLVVLIVLIGGTRLLVVGFRRLANRARARS